MEVLNSKINSKSNGFKLWLQNNSYTYKNQFPASVQKNDNNTEQVAHLWGRVASQTTESLNNANTGARTQTPTLALSWYVNAIQKRNITVKKQCDKLQNNRIVPKIKEKLKKAKCSLECDNYEVQESQQRIEYSVKNCHSRNNSIFTVNLLNRTCTCFGWQFDRFPCRHAIIVCSKTSGLEIENYIHPEYTSNTWKTQRDILSSMVVPDLDSIIANDNLGNDRMLTISFPVSSRRPPGRPNETRRKMWYETARSNSNTTNPRKKHKCSTCKSFGHNSRNCPGIRGGDVTVRGTFVATTIPVDDLNNTNATDIGSENANTTTNNNITSTC